MKKSKHLLAVLILAALMAQLAALPAQAASSAGTLGMPKIPFSIKWTVTEEADGFYISAGLSYGFSPDPEEIAEAVDYHKPYIDLKVYYDDEVIYITEYYDSGLTYMEDEKIYVDMGLFFSSAYGFRARVSYDDGIVIDEYSYSTVGALPYSFSDVPENAWFHKYVDYAANTLGLVKGKTEEAFAPDDNITYAEAITFAVRMMDLWKSVSPDYTPKNGQKWYQPYLDAAKSYGIAWQYSDYDAAATRSDFVHIIFSTLPATEYEILYNYPDGSIPDVPMSSEYAREIYIFYRAGVLFGGDGGRFYPYSNIKRSEVAAILCRINGLEPTGIYLS